MSIPNLIKNVKIYFVLNCIIYNPVFGAGMKGGVGTGHFHIFLIIKYVSFFLEKLPF